MACTPFDVPGLGRGFICGRARRVACIVCGERAVRLCDGADGEDVDGVCSAGLCARHTRRDGERDLCPRHAEPELASAFQAPPAAMLARARRARTGRHVRPAPREQLELALGGRR